MSFKKIDRKQKSSIIDELLQDEKVSSADNGNGVDGNEVSGISVVSKGISKRRLPKGIEAFSREFQVRSDPCERKDKSGLIDKEYVKHTSNKELYDKNMEKYINERLREGLNAAQGGGIEAEEGTTEQEIPEDGAGVAARAEKKEGGDLQILERLAELNKSGLEERKDKRNWVSGLCEIPLPIE